MFREASGERPPTSFYKRALLHDIFRHGALVFIATTAANCAFFLFHMVLSRKLGVSTYGALYAVLSAAQLASLPAGIFTTVVSKVAAEFRTRDEPGHLRTLTIFLCKAFALLALFYVLVGIVSAPWTAPFMRVPSWAVVLAATIASGAILVAALRGISQGTQEFGSYSASIVLEAVGKATFGTLLVVASFGLGGALWGFLAGSVLGGLYTISGLWMRYGRAEPMALHVDWRRVFSTTIGAAALTASIVILSYGDVLLVKHYFSAHDAGIYAAASLAGKILFLLVSFAPLVLIPKVVDRLNRGKNPALALTGAMLMVGALSGTGLVAFFFASAAILHLLVGGAFAEAAPLLPWYGLAMALLAVTNVVASYSIALHRFAFGVPLIVAAVAEIFVIASYHPTLASVVAVLAGGNALALLAVSVSLIVRKR